MVAPKSSVSISPRYQMDSLTEEYIDSLKDYLVLRTPSAQGYLADLTGPTPQPSVGEEGIARGGWISRTELLRHIRDGEILDGYTQTAILLYLLHKNSQS